MDPASLYRRSSCSRCSLAAPVSFVERLAVLLAAQQARLKRKRAALPKQRRCHKPRALPVGEAYDRVEPLTVSHHVQPEKPVW